MPFLLLYHGQYHQPQQLMAKMYCTLYPSICVTGNSHEQASHAGSCPQLPELQDHDLS